MYVATVFGFCPKNRTGSCQTHTQRHQNLEKGEEFFSKPWVDSPKISTQKAICMLYAIDLDDPDLTIFLTKSPGFLKDFKRGALGSCYLDVAPSSHRSKSRKGFLLRGAATVE